MNLSNQELKDRLIELGCKFYHTPTHYNYFFLWAECKIDNEYSYSINKFVDGSCFISDGTVIQTLLALNGNIETYTENEILEIIYKSMVQHKLGL